MTKAVIRKGCPKILPGWLLLIILIFNDGSTTTTTTTDVTFSSSAETSTTEASTAETSTTETSTSATSTAETSTATSEVFNQTTNGATDEFTNTTFVPNNSTDDWINTTAVISTTSDLNSATVHWSTSSVDWNITEVNWNTTTVNWNSTTADWNTTTTIYNFSSSYRYIDDVTPSGALGLQPWTNEVSTTSLSKECLPSCDDNSWCVSGICQCRDGFVAKGGRCRRLSKCEKYPESCQGEQYVCPNESCVCDKGYVKDTQMPGRCFDLDECKMGIFLRNCKKFRKTCRNTAGSYSCDPVCTGNTGYNLTSGMCVGLIVPGVPVVNLNLTVSGRYRLSVKLNAPRIGMLYNIYIDDSGVSRDKKKVDMVKPLIANVSSKSVRVWATETGADDSIYETNPSEVAVYEDKFSVVYSVVKFGMEKEQCEAAVADAAAFRDLKELFKEWMSMNLVAAFGEDAVTMVIVRQLRCASLEAGASVGALGNSPSTLLNSLDAAIAPRSFFNGFPIIDPPSFEVVPEESIPFILGDLVAAQINTTAVKLTWTVLGVENSNVTYAIKCRRDNNSTCNLAIPYQMITQETEFIALCDSNCTEINGRFYFTIRATVGERISEPELRDASPLLVHPCEPLQVSMCIWQQSSLNCTCGCKAGYQLNPLNPKQCIDIDECASGQITCHQQAFCNNVPGSYACQCYPNSTGDGVTSCVKINPCDKFDKVCSDVRMCKHQDELRCECPRGTSDENSTVCQEINECLVPLNPCEEKYGAQVICEDRPYNDRSSPRYSCRCANGFDLRLNSSLCEDINECSSMQMTCPDHGFCVNEIGSARCDCEPGFDMVDGVCQDVNECLNGSVCLNGVCANQVGTFSCTCNSGFLLQPDKTCTLAQNCSADSDCDGGFCSLNSTCACQQGYKWNDTACQRLEDSLNCSTGLSLVNGSCVITEKLCNCSGSTNCDDDGKCSPLDGICSITSYWNELRGEIVTEKSCMADKCGFESHSLSSSCCNVSSEGELCNNNLRTPQLLTGRGEVRDVSVSGSTIATFEYELEYVDKQEVEAVAILCIDNCGNYTTLMFYGELLEIPLQQPASWIRVEFVIYIKAGADLLISDVDVYFPPQITDLNVWQTASSVMMSWNVDAANKDIELIEYNLNVTCLEAYNYTCNSGFSKEGMQNLTDTLNLNEFDWYPGQFLVELHGVYENKRTVLSKKLKYALNECYPNKLMNHSCAALTKCVDDEVGYRCEPATCEDSPCSPNAYCMTIDKAPGVACFCDKGYVGDGVNCTRDLACLSNPCLNSGMCLDIEDDEFHCVCLSGFTGLRCETNINDCTDTSCINGGVCIDGINNFTCQCHPEWTGKICEQELLSCTQDGDCGWYAVCLSNYCYCREGFYPNRRLCLERTCPCNTGCSGGKCSAVDRTCFYTNTWDDRAEQSITQYGCEAIDACKSSANYTYAKQCCSPSVLNDCKTILPDGPAYTEIVWNVRDEGVRDVKLAFVAHDYFVMFKQWVIECIHHCRDTTPLITSAMTVSFNGGQAGSTSTLLITMDNFGAHSSKKRISVVNAPEAAYSVRLVEIEEDSMECYWSSDQNNDLTYSVTLSCTGHPECINKTLNERKQEHRAMFFGLKQGLLYSCHVMVHYGNKTSELVSSSKVLLPVKVTSFGYTMVTKQSVWFHWAVHSSSASSYTCDMRVNKNRYVIQGSESFQVSQLELDNKYRATLCCCVLIGSDCPCGNEKEITLITYPDKVRAVRLVGVSPEKAVVAWSLPGGYVHSISISVSQGDDNFLLGLHYHVFANKSGAEFYNLLPNTRYVILIMINSRAQAGEAGEKVSYSFTTRPADYSKYLYIVGGVGLFLILVSFGVCVKIHFFDDDKPRIDPNINFLYQNRAGMPPM